MLFQQTVKLGLVVMVDGVLSSLILTEREAQHIHLWPTLLFGFLFSHSICEPVQTANRILREPDAIQEQQADRGRSSNCSDQFSANIHLICCQRKSRLLLWRKTAQLG